MMEFRKIYYNGAVYYRPLWGGRTVVRFQGFCRPGNPTRQFIVI